MHRRRLALLATSTIAACAGALAIAHGASAASTLLPTEIDDFPRAGTVESGQVVVKLSAGASALKLKGTGEVSVKGSTLQLLADTSSDAAIDTTTMRGSVAIDGSLSITGSKGTAKLTTITFSPGKAKAVTAKLGKKVVTLGTLSGGKATFARQADGLLTGAKFSIGSAGAKAINKVTGNGIRAGVFGTVRMSVTTVELPLQSGLATITLDPSILQLIASNGFTITAQPPATFNGSVVTLPLIAGAFDPTGLTGRLILNGTVRVSNTAGDKAIDLFNWHGAITGTQRDVYASINKAIAAPIATVDTSGVTAGLDGKLFTATNAKLVLSKIAVATLKQSFGITVAQGAPLGVVNLTGTISGTF